MPHFTVTELERADLAAAWPVVRAAAPGLDPERWQSFAEALIDRGGGVIGVAAEDGGLHGIATYDPVEKLHQGKVLKVDTLVSFELSRRAPVRRLLCEALDRLAHLLGCDALAVTVPSRGYVAQMEKKAKGLTDLGQQLDEVVFLKKLGREAEAKLAPA